MTFKDTIRLLFDKHGRRIPKDLLASVCNDNRDFRLDQPELKTEVDYANRLMRLHGCLNVDTGITAEQLKAETERLLTLIRENSQIANIARGVWLPVVLPKLITDDIGAEIEYYLTAVGNSYIKKFSDRKFCNHLKGALAGKVDIVDGSRHDEIIRQVKRESIIGIHFPNPLQGFSVHADREQMSVLPEGFILSGIDTPIAMAMYPDVLARDWNTPCLDLAALSCQSSNISLYFWARDDGLDFSGQGPLGFAYGNNSGALLFLG